LKEIHKWAKNNNYLKGEKFALSGEFLNKSEDDWKSLITEFNIKDAIKKSIHSLENKMKNLDSRGLLFIGVPGTGKTKTGRILLNNVDSTFIWVSSRDFMRGFNILSLAFRLARDLAPTVLFIEDIDTWLRGPIVDLLKTELDGLRQNKGIITILTSNSPEKLPDALLDRPGRFHHVLRFPLPNDEFRKEMILSWVGDIDEKILNRIVEKTEHFSGAHIKELVDFAKIIADEEDIEMGKALLRSLERLIAQRELIAEIRENKKSFKEIVLDKIILKAGAVLNRKNKSDLNNAQQLIQNVLDSAETAEPAEEGKQADELEIEEPAELEIEEKDEQEQKDDAEEKEETIDISADEIKLIVSEALNEQANKVGEKVKEIVGDNFKRLTGKVI
jgi:SpoVK/Ycf46/Vps4 family AAA+-type ATPase